MNEMNRIKNEWINEKTKMKMNVLRWTYVWLFEFKLLVYLKTFIFTSRQDISLSNLLNWSFKRENKVYRNQTFTPKSIKTLLQNVTSKAM